MGKDEILLGDTVKCKYTGIKGVAVTRSEFINGCIQFGVAQKIKAGQPFGLETQCEASVDLQSLVIVKKGERHDKEEEEIEEESTGGRMRITKRRGY